MHTWLGFILFPFIIFISLFLFFTTFLIGFVIGCGFHPEYISSCKNMFISIIVIMYVSAIGLGYITAKFAPSNRKYFLSSLYNFIFSLSVLFFILNTDSSYLNSFVFSMIFYLCSLTGIATQKYINKNITI